MKNFKLFVLSAIVGGFSLLVGCGNGGATGSAARSNAPLGRTPAIFAEVAAKKKAMEKSLSSSRSVKDHQQKLQDFEEYRAKSMQNANVEAQKVIGNKIPHTGDDAYDEFEIKDITIEDYHEGRSGGSFIVRVKVASKYDMEVQNRQSQCGEGEYSLVDTRMYFALLTEDDRFISLGELNPFSGKSYLQSVDAEYKAGQSILAGQLCHSQGAPISINCHSYDYTRFGKILFLTEKAYRDIRRQAYGF